MKKKLSVSAQLYLTILAIILAVTLVAAAASFTITIRTRERDLDTLITDIAQMVAESPATVSLLTGEGNRDDAIRILTHLNRQMTQLDVLVVCDTNSVRYYHTSPDRIGGVFFGGDQDAILTDGVPYISVAEGTLGMQRRAFHAVFDEDGTIIGFAMASVLSEKIDQVRVEILQTFLIVLLLLAIAGALIPVILRRYLKQILESYKQEQVEQANRMVETLRAFNHEFMNKLHVILGLLETGQVDRARQYITDTSLVSGQAVSDISRRVPDPGVAALLIGKLVRASELGITLVLKQDTYFSEKEHPLPPDVLITVCGNLIENAMDELNSAAFEEKRIEVGIYADIDHTTILCDDTGGGIPEEILFSLYDPHTTTKGEGHGNGYALIREIIDRYEGVIHIDTEKGEGTSIQIDLPV